MLIASRAREHDVRFNRDSRFGTQLRLHNILLNKRHSVHFRTLYIANSIIIMTLYMQVNQTLREPLSDVRELFQVSNAITRRLFIKPVKF